MVNAYLNFHGTSVVNTRNIFYETFFRTFYKTFTTLFPRLQGNMFFVRQQGHDLLFDLRLN